jgi:hypothetical protein
VTPLCATSSGSAASVPSGASRTRNRVEICFPAVAILGRAIAALHLVGGRADRRLNGRRVGTLRLGVRAAGGGEKERTGKGREDETVHWGESS